MNAVLKIDKDMKNSAKIFNFPNDKKIETLKKVKRINGTVNPIKDKEDIERAKQYYLNQKDYFHNAANLRNYCLFVVSLNCARRISDTLKLRISDVMNEEGEIKNT